MSDLQSLVDLVTKSLAEVREKEFNESRSETIAAACQEIEMKLADVLAEAEGDSKNAKNVIELVTAQVASEIRKTNVGTKITEGAIAEKVLQDTRVIEAKNSYIDKEKYFKKWQYIFNTMKDNHIFFRNLDK